MMTFAILSIAVAMEPPPAFSAANEELRAYLLEAADRHPGLHARYEEWQAAMERIPQAKSLDDPMLTYGQFVQSEMNRAKVMVEQRFPWFGTLRARGEEAAREAEAAQARFFAERNVVFAEVKKAYFEYAFLGESVRIVEAQAALLTQIEQVAQSNYSLGLGSQNDLLRIQIEKTELDDRYASLQQYRPALSAQLCKALGRPTSEEMPWPQPASLPPAPPPAPVVSAQLRVANPDLSAMEKTVESRRQGIVLAKKKGWPDFTLGVEYMSISKPREVAPDRIAPASLMAADRLRTNARANRQTLSTEWQQGQALTLPRPTVADVLDVYEVATTFEPMNYSNGGEDDVAITFKVNVPIWRKRVKAGVAEAEHMATAAEHEQRQRAIELDAAARAALYEIGDGQRRLDLLKRSLQPQAQQVYENIQAAYASSEEGVTFLDVIASVRDILDYELEAADMARRVQVGAADLEAILGGPWAAGGQEAAAPVEATPAPASGTE